MEKKFGYAAGLEQSIMDAEEAGHALGYERCVWYLADIITDLGKKLALASASASPHPETLKVSVDDVGDHVCQHGTALDVHCCNCHSGFIFDREHECPSMDLSLHRCKICGTRWLLWPDAVHGGGWNLLDKWQRPGSCCDNVAMGDQIEHLRDFPALPASASPQAKGEDLELIEQCARCGEDIRFIDGEWLDRDTHTTCEILDAEGLPRDDAPKHAPKDTK